MGEKILWLAIMIPISLLFTLLGVYAWKRKKPMWFWSGSTVKDEEISDVPAYNRANGIMWIVFSLISWASAIVGIFDITAAGIVMIAGYAVGIPGLVVAYRRIYRRYGNRPNR